MESPLSVLEPPSVLKQDPCERVVVALDFASAALALELVDRLEGRCRWVKVGLELYLGAGPEIVRTLTLRGLKVFLDLKLHDIPNTVAGAVRAVSASEASLLTVHAAGGPAMLRAAAEAAGSVPGAPKLLAVTVLTSMDAAQLRATGVEGSPAEQVLRLARLAGAAGISGLVCSPKEVGMLRRELGVGPLVVVPGIRPSGADVGDQNRIATPGKAIGDGASLLVVGRPVTRAGDPLGAFEGIVREIAAGAGKD